MLSIPSTFALLLASAANADNEVSVLRSLHKAYPEWKPRGIVDVGANVGGWTTKVQENFFPGVKTFMIEASPAHEKILEETKEKFGAQVIEYKIALLSEKNGDTVDFYSGDSSTTGNSMFKEKTKFFRDIKPDKRITAKLDTIVGHMEHVDYVKLDVQGAELVVLSGATETLKKATFVQLEISVVEYNHGGACWHEVDHVLRRNGYFLYDFGDASRNQKLFRTKGIGQIDLLYANPSSSSLPQWLVDNNVEFCGSNRIGLDATSVEGERGVNLKLCCALVAAFLGGYLAGNFKKTRNGTKQN